MSMILAANANAQGSHVGEWRHPDAWDKPAANISNAVRLAQIAEAEGRDPVDVYVDRLIASEGRELWNFWAFGGELEKQWAYMQMDHCIPMLADAGAHVGIFTDTDSPTFLLSELTRRQGVYSLPEAIHRITQASADVMGLKDRGSVKEGWAADLNVIDYDNLRLRKPEMAFDLPAGGRRLVQRAEGLNYTLVNGVVTFEGLECTGATPGELMLHGER